MDTFSSHGCFTPAVITFPNVPPCGVLHYIVLCSIYMHQYCICCNISAFTLCVFASNLKTVYEVFAAICQCVMHSTTFLCTQLCQAQLCNIYVCRCISNILLQMKCSFFKRKKKYLKKMFTG